MDMQRLYDQIKKDEGFRAHPYRCSAGALTIGYGHNLDSGPLPWPIPAAGITEREAEILMMDDADHAVLDAARLVPTFYILPESVQQVLANMSYNLGITKLSRFRKMLLAVWSGDYSRAADEMVKSRWYSQVGDRALRLAREMRASAWEHRHEGAA